MPPTVVQVFASHSQLDVETCDKFDKIAVRVGIKVFRSEYETIDPPAWETIKTEMKRSKALFLLVGPKLVEEQAKNTLDWKFTQNWIAYEVGLACALGIDVWVVCDNAVINFPVPYLNNYSIGGLHIGANSFHKSKLQKYLEGETFPLEDKRGRHSLDCPYENCGAKFNFWTEIGKGGSITCPTCLRSIIFSGGWLLPTNKP